MMKARLTDKMRVKAYPKLVQALRLAVVPTQVGYDGKPRGVLTLRPEEVEQIRALLRELGED